MYLLFYREAFSCIQQKTRQIFNIKRPFLAASSCIVCIPALTVVLKVGNLRFSTLAALLKYLALGYDRNRYHRTLTGIH